MKNTVCNGNLEKWWVERCFWGYPGCEVDDKAFRTLLIHAPAILNVDPQGHGSSDTARVILKATARAILKATVRVRMIFTR